MLFGFGFWVSIAGWRLVEEGTITRSRQGGFLLVVSHDKENQHKGVSWVRMASIHLPYL
jgi:hypothetical protein